MTSEAAVVHATESATHDRVPHFHTSHRFRSIRHMAPGNAAVRRLEILTKDVTCKPSQWR